MRIHYIQPLSFYVTIFQALEQCFLYKLLQLILITFKMQKVLEAKNLAIKASSYMTEGNYDNAISCYDKLKVLLKNQTGQKENTQKIKEQIDKYTFLKSQAQAKKQEKEINLVKMSTHFGFPKKNVKMEYPPQKQQKILGKQDKSKKIELSVNKREQLRQTKRPGPIINPAKSLDNKIPVAKQAKQKSPFKPKKPEVPTKPQFEPGEKKKIPPVKPSKQEKIEIDPSIQDLIIRNIDVSFNDIVGLEEAKAILEEAVIRPRKRPDLYTGIRAPPKGLLLYGPPGNGKTYICKALAKQSGCTFIAISASSVLNKFVGESEKTIKRIFDTASMLAPCIIFVDEIDSMLTSRSQHENDASRRLKTQFFVLMEGIDSPKSGQVLVIGATNLPQELDNAAKRRFSKFIYIGNPNSLARKEMLLRNLSEVQYELQYDDINKIVQELDCYSASEIRNIVAEACMIPLRELQKSTLQKIHSKDIRKVNIKDFMGVLSERKPIISKQQLEKYRQKV